MSDNMQEAPKPLRRVRIQNDGDPGYNTKITDADTGQSIDNIYHAKIVDIGVRDNPRILLWAHNPVVDITGVAETTHVCPLCKARRDVEPAEDNKEVWKHKIKIDIDDTDIAYAVQKLRELQWQHDEFMRESIGPAEAINAFGLWLLSRGEFLVDPSTGVHDGTRIKGLVDRFCQAQGWYIKNEKHMELIRDTVEDGQIQVTPKVEEG